ncbi:MAG: alpha/beta hydrolase [Ruminococcaceae bacterium]|nr:alpha/beta hydrolase [Oscillospiraceae bacterium]
MKEEYIKIDHIPAKLYSAENALGTVLAIHGFAGSKESNAIKALAERLCRDKLNVLTFDLPAHGERTEPSEGLLPDNCIADIIAAENYIKNHFTGTLHAFATSYGAMCLLHRLERGNDSYKSIVLRVPAVNMASSLVRIAAATSKSPSAYKANGQDFVINMQREYRIPYCFYELLSTLHCMRHSEHWDSERIMTVYAGNDELVARADTESFLRQNPAIKNLCIEGSGHRMAEKAEFLENAIKSSAEFILLHI